MKADGFLDAAGFLDEPTKAPAAADFLAAEDFLAEEPPAPPPPRPLRGLSDDMTDAVMPPPEEPRARRRDGDTHPLDPMLRRSYVDQERQKYGSIPESQRIGALRAAAKRNDVVGRAAKVILQEAGMENQRARQMERDRPELVKAVRGAKGGGSGGGSGGRVVFPETEPDLPELVEGITAEEALSRRTAGLRANASDTSVQGFIDKGKDRRVADSMERTWAEAASDGAVALAKGGNSVMQLPVAFFAPGSESYDWLKENGRTLAEMESPAMKARRQQMAEDLKAEPSEWGKLFISISDPAINFSTAIEQLAIVGSILATGGVAGAVGRASMAPAGAAVAGAAGRVGAVAGMAGAGGVASGGDAAGDVYDRLMDPRKTPNELLAQNSDYTRMLQRGMSPAAARKAIAVSKSKIAAALAVPLGAVSGVVGLRAPGAAPVQGGVGTGLLTAGKEMGGEIAQEIGTKAAGNVTVASVDPSQQLNEGFGEAAGGAIAGSSVPSVVAGMQATGPASAAEKFARALDADVAATDLTPKPRVFTTNSVPKDRVLTPEELDGLRQEADARNAAAVPVPAAVVEPPATQGEARPPLAVGVANVQRGTLADRARAAANGSAGDVATEPDAVGAVGGSDAAGGVDAGGRAAGQADGAAPTTPEPAAAAPAPVGDRQGVDESGVIGRLRAGYDDRRTKLTRAAQLAEREAESAARQAAELRRVGMTAQAEKLEQKTNDQSSRARARRLSAARLPQLQEPQQGPALDQFNALADAMERTLGVRPVAYEDTSQAAADGFFDTEAGVAMVNISKPEMNIAQTIFHEHRHLMRKQAEAGNVNAQNAEKLLDTVWSMISDTGKRTFAEKYLFRAEVESGAATVDEVMADPKKLDLLKEEMLADFMGRRAVDKPFMRKLAKRDPKNFGDFVRSWISTLTQMIKELRGNRRPGLKNIDKTIANLQEAKRIAEEVMVEWAKANPGAVKPADQEALFSLRQDLDTGAFNPAVEYGMFDDEDVGKKDIQGALQTIARIEGDTLAGVRDRYAYMQPDEVIERARELLEEQEANKSEGVQPEEPDIEDLEDFEADEEIPVGEVKPLSEQEMRQVMNELSSEQQFASASMQVAEPAEVEEVLTDFSAVPKKLVTSAGIMAEQAFKTTFSPARVNPSIMRSRISIDGTTHYISYANRRSGLADANTPYSIVRDVLERDADGRARGSITLSQDAAAQWVTRFAASAELFRRGFDLHKAIDKAAQKRVLDTWTTLRDKRGAFEFRRDIEARGKDNAEIVQNIADSMLAGTRWSVKASSHSHFGDDGIFHDASVRLLVYKDGMLMGRPAFIEYRRPKIGRPPVAIMHTEGFDEGSGAGKPFYQVALAFADARDATVYADPRGLLAINNYRRTEQQFSAALRSMKTKNVQPGYGQRVYGWNEKPKGANQEGQNLVRLAVAAARNAAEFFPGIRAITYDIAANKFLHLDGSSAETDVAIALMEGGDARQVSLSRSTLARAAITFQAIDSTLDLEDIDTVKSPILYSARAQETEEAVSPQTRARPTRNQSSGGRIRRNIAELVQSAQSMAGWKDWFERHEQTLQEMFGGDAPLFQRILSATSQASTVPVNVALAIKAYRQYYASAPFTGYLPAVISNLERIRAEDDLRGAKISEYGKANDGDPNGIAVDRHIAELMFNTSRPNRRQIDAAQRRIRQIAERLGWAPREVQSALWAYNQVRNGKNPDEVQSYDTLLRRRLAEVAEARRLAAEARANGFGIPRPDQVAGRGDGFSTGSRRAREPDDERDAGIRAEGIDLGREPTALRFSGRESFAEMLGDDYIRLGDRTVSFDVLVADTGDVAKMTMPARQAMLDAQQRVSTMRQLLSCLSR